MSQCCDQGIDAVVSPGQNDQKNNDRRPLSIAMVAGEASGDILGPVSFVRSENTIQMLTVMALVGH